MKWLWIVIALAFLLIGYAPQFRTHYQALPRIVRVRRRLWAFGGQRWGLVVSFVRVV